MADDLAHFHERITLTRADIDDLNRLIERFCAESINHRIEQEGRSGFNIYAVQTKPLPVAIPRRVGLVANELRSILDNLACTLARRNGKGLSDVYFPISKSQEIFEDDGLKKIRKLSASDQAKIIALKPYREGNRMLFALHEADRTRKHRSLVGCVGNSSGMNIGGVSIISGGHTVFENNVINGVPVELIKFSGGQHTLLGDVGHEVLIATGSGAPIPIRPFLSLAFEDPEDLAGASVVPTLFEFADLVETIVAQFD